MELLTIHDVMKITTMSRSSIYAKVAEGSFPKQIRITTRRVAWRIRDIEKWIEKAAT